VKEEFGPKREVRPRGMSWFWWLVALLLVLGFAWSVLRPLF
jgi:hypothetical protein